MKPKDTKRATGTYDGKRFKLLDCVVHTYGTEYIMRVDGFVIEFLEGGKKYVLDYDPLLKFDKQKGSSNDH